MTNSTKTTKYSVTFLAVILAAGTIATFSPSLMLRTAQAQPYDGGMDRDRESDRKQVVSVNSFECNQNNINVNGLELNLTSFPFLSELAAELTEASEGNYGASSYGSDGSYGGHSNKDKDDFRFICINNNNNNVVIDTTATLTVKKQVFGCDNIVPLGTFPLEEMNCSGLQNNSSAAWLDCNTNASISGTIYCLSLHESIFDIEVLDDQNSQIQQFEGSEQGTTIPNLQPGTYTVNEIEQPEGIFDNQLADDVTTNVRFSNQEFPDGGLLVNTTAPLLYGICFEYEDEQGNDCSTVTLAAGEERTCIVKNYIRGGGPVT